MKKISFIVVVLGLLGVLLPLQSVSAAMAPLPQINSFTAEPAVKGGWDSYTFTWSSTNSKYCVISDRGNFFPGNKKRNPSGSVNKTLTGLNLGTFNLYCYDKAGNYDEARVTVRINRPEPQITSFTASPSKRGGDIYKFTWSSENAEYCKISDDPSKGGYSYFPNEKTRKSTGSVNKNLIGLLVGEFNLKCYNSVGTYDEASVTVKINRPEVVINSFTASPIKSGSNIHKFAWSSENAEYCKISDDPNKGGYSYFPNEKTRKSSGSVNKKLTGLIVGDFNIRCYNSIGNYDEASVTVKIPRVF